MSKQVSWGILSTANIGIKHVIPAILEAPQCRILAVASRNPAQARAVADRFGIEKSYGSYEELLADPAIDAIYNPLPNHLHTPWTIKAMEAGKHIFTEKPTAETLADALQQAGLAVSTPPDLGRAPDGGPDGARLSRAGGGSRSGRGRGSQLRGAGGWRDAQARAVVRQHEGPAARSLSQGLYPGLFLHQRAAVN